MSDAISALPGATATGLAKISEAGLVGMVTLKADLSDKTVAAAILAVTGFKMPGQRLILQNVEGAVGWMAPDELLIVCPHAGAPQVVAELDAKLKGTHHLALNVSDARVVFDIAGHGAREVLAKLAPVDLHPDHFQPGQLRRTRIAQVAAAFWMTGDDAFRLVTFRSVARYAFDLLAVSARTGGEVGYFRG